MGIMATGQTLETLAYDGCGEVWGILSMRRRQARRPQIVGLHDV
jgi:hypothetical protein